MHVFCIVEKECKERSLWSSMYFLYHLSIAVWVILVLTVDMLGRLTKLLLMMNDFYTVLFYLNSKSENIIEDGS